MNMAASSHEPLEYGGILRAGVIISRHDGSHHGQPKSYLNDRVAGSLFWYGLMAAVGFVLVIRMKISSLWIRW